MLYVLPDTARVFYHVQQPLVLVVIRYRLAAGAEALCPRVRAAVSVCVRMEAGAGSATTLQTTGHGFSRAVQEKHGAGLAHLTRHRKWRVSRLSHHRWVANLPHIRPWPRTPPSVSCPWGTRWPRDPSPAVGTPPPHHTAAPARCPTQQHSVNDHS